MRIMVCGSIGFGGIDEIKRYYSLLRDKGFDTVDHISDRRMDYSNVQDFRGKRSLSRRIVEHDLQYVSKADLLLVLSNGPSYGTGIEIHEAKRIGKTVVFLAREPVPTPWPVNFSDFVVHSDEELFSLLGKLKKRRARGH
jgi:hypothetical protein